MVTYVNHFTCGVRLKSSNMTAGRWPIIFVLTTKRIKPLLAQIITTQAEATMSNSVQTWVTTQPFDYGLALTHHVRGSIGQYSQQSQAKERTWSIGYGHDWRITKKISFSYEIGRKKNIYDGDAEFNNYGNVNLSYAF